jgi:cytochrome c
MGRAIAALPNYRYSTALAAKRSERWNWNNMDAWLEEPARFVPRTKMTFVGIRNAQRRADLLLYLNEQGGTLRMPHRPVRRGSPGPDSH